MSTENEGCDWGINMAKMGWKRNDEGESDGESNFDEGLRNVHDDERVEESGFEAGSCDVEVTKMGSVTMNEVSRGRVVVGGWVKSGVTWHHLPS